MNVATVIALALILARPVATKDFHVRATGQSVHIRAQLSRQYLGEPLRFNDGFGRSACFDDNGELTIRCVDKFYGAAITATFQFEGNGVMTDTITNLANHPKVIPLPPTTRTVQTVNKEAIVYRVFGYDETGMMPGDVAHFRQIQEPFWVEVREDIALDDRPILSLYWHQTLNEIRLERIEPH
jgi:hypothetical protein